MHLAAEIEAAVEAGVVALVSFGIAGALDPALAPGRLIVADTVGAADATFVAHRGWSTAIAERTGATRASIAAGDLLVPSAAMKARLRADSGAVAVDMESHVVARIARRHGLPFVVFRAIADPAKRSLPPAATVAMKEGGGIDLAAVLRSVATSPGQIPGLVAIARDTRAALGALRRARGQLGAGLHYLDLGELLVDVV